MPLSLIHISFALCAAFFLRKGERIALRDFKPQARTIGHALKLGMAPFGLTLLPEVTVVAVNMNAVVQGGEVAVAAYAVISYTAMILSLIHIWWPAARLRCGSSSP